MQLNDAVAPLLCYGYRRYFAASSDPLRMATIRTTVRALRLFSPSDLNDHIFEASGVFIQHFAPVFGGPRQCQSVERLPSRDRRLPARS